MPVPPALVVAEPPAAYLVRSPLVVDCSVLSAVLFEEVMRDDALRQLAGRSLHAPTLIDHEMASVALKKRRLGWPVASIEAALADYASHALQLHRIDVSAQLALAEHYDLSAYDAAYLALAAALKAPLATFDRKLGAAATKHLRALE
jgi:predicted nucleic acid-binding protein